MARKRISTQALCANLVKIGTELMANFASLPATMQVSQSGTSWTFHIPDGGTFTISMKGGAA